MAVRWDARKGEYVKDTRPAVKPPVRQQPRGCPHYTRDQGCPMHGETCATEYRRG